MKNEGKLSDTSDLKYSVFDPSKHRDILYELLIRREYSISHKKNPLKEDHAEFCLSNPYRYWYLIFESEEPIGSFYLTFQNCIAINLLKETKQDFLETLDFILQNFQPEPEVLSITPPYFYCNTNPSNKVYINAIEEYGGDLIQFSYSFKENMNS